MTNIHIGARAGAAALLAVALSGAAYAADAAPDLSGIYWASEYHAKIQVVGGGELPLTPEGKAAYEKNIAGLKDGSLVDNARRFCVPDGLPRVLANPYPFEIVYGPPGQITIIYELKATRSAWCRWTSRCRARRSCWTWPFYNGHSVGHFEGDTLVIEVPAGFNEKTFVDATGAPHSDELRTVERIRRISPTELEDVITIHDPMYYTRDWQARFVYTDRAHRHPHRGLPWCGEPHRDLSPRSRRAPAVRAGRNRHPTEKDFSDAKTHDRPTAAHCGGGGLLRLRCDRGVRAGAGQ